MTVAANWDPYFTNGNTGDGPTTLAVILSRANFHSDVFTPTLLFGGNAVGMAGSFRGYYTFVGPLLQFSLEISLTALGSSTGPASIAGLPYPSIVDIPQPAWVKATGLGASDVRAEVVNQAISLNSGPSTGYAVLTNADFNSGSVILVTGTFQAETPNT